MTSLPKVLLSTLITVLIFVSSLFFSFAGGFRLLEVKYYTPRVTGHVNEKLESAESAYASYMAELEVEFKGYLSKEEVVSYIEREPSEKNALERVQTTGRLFQNNPGLEGIRLIENDGVHVHFSTYREDILSETEELVTYANYADRIPYVHVESRDGARRPVVYFDGERNRIILSFPFYDSYTAYRGSMVFYILGDDFTRRLIDQGIVSLNARVCVMNPDGFVFGLPIAGRKELAETISTIWKGRHSNIEQISASDRKEENLFVVTKGDGVKFGWILRQNEFELNDYEKASLLVCLFVTLYLIVFMLFNLRHDKMVIARRRVRKFQYGLLKEFLERKDKVDWNKLQKEISDRRMDVNDDIRKGLGSVSKKYSVQVDRLLDESWRDVMGAIAGFTRSSKDSVVQMEVVPPVAEKAVVPEVPSPVKEAEPAEELEEVEELEELEELEEIPEAEPIEDAEPVEDLEEVEELEELEEIPEAEPIEDAEPVEDLEEVEELEEIPEAEPIEDAEPVDDAESVDIIEESLSDVMEKDSPDPADREGSELKKKQASDSFNVAPLTFSTLDNERGEE